MTTPLLGFTKILLFQLCATFLYLSPYFTLPYSLLRPWGSWPCGSSALLRSAAPAPEPLCGCCYCFCSRGWLPVPERET